VDDVITCVLTITLSNFRHHVRCLWHVTFCSECEISKCALYKGFLELMSEDQMALLKSSFMELSVLRLSYRFYVISVVAFNVVENYFLLIRVLFRDGNDDNDDWKQCLWSVTVIDSLQEFTLFM